MDPRLGRPVVVGVDGSEDGMRALRFGVRRARQLRTGIRVVHVLPANVPMAPMAPYLSGPVLHEVGAKILDDAEQVLADLAPELPRTIELGRDSRHRVFRDRSADAESIVLGSRPRSPTHWGAGSTTNQVALGAHCPVFAVPASWPEGKEHGPVVVAVAGEPDVVRLTAVGMAEARRRGTHVVVLHAWRPPDPYAFVPGIRTEAERWTASAECELAEATAGLRSDDPDVHVELDVRFAAPRVAVAEAAADASLVVVGRHQGLFGGSVLPILGAVPHAVLQAHACPVEVVPPDSDRPG